MMILCKTIGIVIIILFLTYVFELVRKKKLKVYYYVYWFFVSAAIALSILVSDVIAPFFCVIETPKFVIILFIAFVSLALLTVKLCMVLSKMQDSIKELIQELSLLKFKNKKKERK